jgi:hypothetical protein
VHLTGGAGSGIGRLEKIGVSPKEVSKKGHLQDV